MPAAASAAGGAPSTIAQGVGSPFSRHIWWIIPMCCCGMAGPTRVSRVLSMVRATDQLVHSPSGVRTTWKPYVPR